MHFVNSGWKYFTSLAVYGFLTAASLAQTTAQRGGEWEFAESDCNFVVQVHERDESGRLGQAAERVQIRAGAGTYVRMVHDIDHARIIDDLHVSVWIRSPRRGLQAYARVVLPDAIDPETGRFATVYLPGQQYDQPGGWQRLQVADLTLKFQRQMRVLRARLHRPVSTHGAYLDAVVVNVYGGPGTTEAFLGHIEQEGHIEPPVAPVGEVATVAFEDSLGPNPDDVPQRKTSRLIVDGRPFFPRVIQHQGEPLRTLADLGFNTVWLDRWPTESENNEASEAGLWIVCPPPDDSHDAVVRFSRVLGWYCSDELETNDVVAQLLKIRRRDPHHRPVIAQLWQNQWLASRELDVVLRRRLTIGTTFELSNYGAWLHQMTHLVRPGTPFWAGVQTELSPAVVTQIRELVGHVDRVPTHVQAVQMRQMALSAVSAGARGLWFESTTRLDDPSPAGELRRHMIELLNHELALVEPWTMGGHRLGEVRGTNAELRVFSLATSRSRLLVPTYVQPGAQYACRPVSGDNTLVIPGVPDSTDAFILNQMGLEPIRRQRISGGLQLHLEAQHADSLVLMTEDPLVVTFVNRTVNSRRRRVIELEQQIADALLRDLEASQSQSLLRDPDRIERWEAARAALAMSRELSEANDLTPAYRFGRQARRQLNTLQAMIWRSSVSQWPSPMSLPSGSAFWLVNLVEGQRTVGQDQVWSENRLKGGDCEALSEMVAAGWRQYQHAPDDIETYLALSPSMPMEGSHCLRLRSRGLTKEAEASVVEYAPIWVNTAPVTVHAGQRVRISGYIRIEQPITGSLDGVVISDSISGEDLALRIRRTKGWQRFEMVRAIDRDDHLTLTIGLHGLGEVFVDELEVAVHEDAPPRTARR